MINCKLLTVKKQGMVKILVLRMNRKKKIINELKMVLKEIGE